MAIVRKINGVLISNTSITGFTYSSSSNTLTISDSNNSNFSASINTMSGLTIYGPLSANTLSANTIYLPTLAAPAGNTVALGINSSGVITTGASVVSASAENVKIPVRNNSGATILKGRAVFVSGASTSLATIGLALAGTNVNTTMALGIVENDILNAANGYVIALGTINNLNTSAFFDGDKVYVSSTIAGGLTTTPPVSPNNVMFIGTVTDAHPTLGKILIDVLYSFKLETLVDVAISTPTDGQVIRYDFANKLWRNVNLPNDSFITGGTFSSTTSSSGGSITFGNSTGGTIVVSGLARPMLYYTEYSVPPSTPPTATGLNSIAIGNGAKTTSSYSIVIGETAGSAPSNSQDIINIGRNSGGAGTGGNGNSVWIGLFAGYNTANSNNSIDIGENAGLGHTTSINSIMLGSHAGNSNNYSGGSFITRAAYSTYIGYNAGRINATNFSGFNNIVIGTNVGVPSGTSSTLNIGGVIWASGLYNGITGYTNTNPQLLGRVAINALPDLNNALFVSGNTTINGTGTTNASKSLTVTSLTGNPKFEVCGNNHIDIFRDQNLDLSNQEGIFIHGAAATAGLNTSNRGVITFLNWNASSISGIQAASVNYGNVRSGIYFLNANSIRFQVTPGGTPQNAMYIVGDSSSGASVNIGTETLVQSAILNVSTTNRGSIPIPKMTQVQRLAISAPVQGLQVYQIDGAEGIYIFTLSGWVLVGSGSTTFSGGTVTGATYFQNGLSANTISATTYLGLPPDIYVTGGTFSPSSSTIIFTNITGGTFNVTGISSSNAIQFTGGTVSGATIFTGGLSANTFSANSLTANTAFIRSGLSAGTVSATTYLNLPAGSTSATLTGGTMSGNTLILVNNSGQSVSVIGIVNTATTLTINGVLKTLNQNNEWLTSQASTGILNYGTGITASTSSSISISPMSGYVVNNETDVFNPTFTLVNYSGNSSVTVTTRNSGIGSYVLLNSSGVPFFQNTFPTSQERKQNIWLGKVAHPLSAVTFVINEPDFSTSPLSQYRDLFQAINYINSGVYPYANGANLNFNITNGNITGKGLNLHNSKLNPDRIQMGPAVPASFFYRTQTGGTFAATTLISAGTSDVNGTATAIGGLGTQATNQWIFAVLGAGFAVQFGQNIYTTLALAIADVGRENFIPFPNFVDNAILIGVLSVTKGATDLTNTSQARFFRADKFGQIIGAQAGISTTTLQAAYDNSIQPQITTSAILGSLQLKGYSSTSGTTPLFQGLNSGGSPTFTVTEGGNVSAVSISATTYLNIPIKYYAESTTAPVVFPVASTANGIAIGSNAVSTANEQFSIGGSAGRDSSGNTNTVMFGTNAGSGATSAITAVFIGTSAGRGNTGTTNPVNIGLSSGQGSYNSNNTVYIGSNAGFGSFSSSTTVGIGLNAGSGTFSGQANVYVGNAAGQNGAANVNTVNVGTSAGQNSSANTNSVMVGNRAGFQATGSSGSVFVGANAGQNTNGFSNQVMIGASAGQDTTGNLGNTVFIGAQAGQSGHGSSNSVFIGNNAGFQSVGSSTSVFIGQQAGQNSSSCGGSVFLGVRTSSGSTAVTNSIVLGVNVALPNSTVGGLNIGGILFGRGITSSGNVIVTGATSTGAIGINVAVPVQALEVSGNSRFYGNLSATTVVIGSATSLHASARVTANIGTTIVYAIPTNAYNGSFIDYTVNNGSSLRAGSIQSIFNTSNIQYTETSTLDIGNTSGITFSMIISGSNAILQASAVTSGWDVKSIIRSI